MAKPDLTTILNDMLGKLEVFLPPPATGNPNNTVSVISLAERDAAIGNFVGGINRAGFSLGDTKAGRFDAGIQFRVWGADVEEVESSLRVVNGAVANAKTNVIPSLKNQGFLKLEATETETGPIGGLWTGTVNYKALYEFTYEDTSDTSGLIVRIPIATNQEVKQIPPLELNTLTNVLVVWNDTETLPLDIRGPLTITGLSGLLWVDGLGSLPGDPVSLLRVSKGASGPPAIHTTLDDFVTAVTAPTSGPLNERIEFPAFSAFTSEFAAVGVPIVLGDWNADGVPDEYQPMTLRFSTPIVLPDSTDRLEVAFGGAAFTPSAVLYLRADTFGVKKFAE